ncbi:MAG: hypothetical protein SV377_02650, partial [Halobacteria archaeon]|nr:hypothetical protein [Halobacteria archaeon]
LATLALGVLFMSDLFMLLLLGWTDATVIEELGIHRLHVMSIGVFSAISLLLVATQLYRPRQHPGALVAGVAIYLVATIVLAAIGSESVMLGVFFGIPATLALLLHPSGRKVFDRESLSPAMLGLFALAVIPLALFVAAQLNLQLTQPIADEHAAHEHYVMMALLGLTVLISGAVAASGIAGWRITAWITAVGVTYFGLLSVFMIGQVGTLGTFWGTLAIVWAVAFVLVAEYSRRENVGRIFGRSQYTKSTAK